MFDQWKRRITPAKKLLWMGGMLIPVLLALSHCRSQKARPPKIALALSGGGYRATLHGLSALKALHNLGLLDRLEVVSGASGGSITAGYYAYHRARFGDEFSFQRFEAELLDGLANYEVPRTVLTTEFVTAGIAATDSLVTCAWETIASPWNLSSIERFKRAFLSCAAQVSSSFSIASLEKAIEEFTAPECSHYNRPDALLQCEGRGPNSFPATLAVFMVGAVLGSDDRSDMMHMFCGLRMRLCAGNGSLANGQKPGLGHPFPELLHMTLFEPWLPGKPLVRMGDLKGSGLTVLINAASNQRGELWTASQKGAGARSRFRDSQIPAWSDYRSERGPTLAEAVAASACYPLFCRPIATPWPQEAGNGTLIDGGVHDNLGVVAIREFYGEEGGKPTLLLAADAQRPYTGADAGESRVDTIIRLHDMLIDQRSVNTLKQIGEWCQGNCDLIHVSLARSDQSEEPLTGLPTDLRPIPNATEMLSAATTRFEAALRKNRRINRWLKGRESKIDDATKAGIAPRTE